MEDYYKELYNKKETDTIPFVQEKVPNQHLNKKISKSELNVIIKKLKKKTAVGFDQFSNEIFKNAPKKVLQMIFLLLI